MSRPLTAGEKLMFETLIKHAKVPRLYSAALDSLSVEDLDDGGMGSLRVISSASGRVMAHQLAIGWYVDQDGVPISIAVNLDQFGELYELDSWKVDFSRRILIPSNASQIHIGLISNWKQHEPE